ncbi:MAG: mechanosensitive ion channel domain-containing protein, partial [Gammaproteobacteria bacterium]
SLRASVAAAIFLLFASPAAGQNDFDAFTSLAELEALQKQLDATPPADVDRLEAIRAQANSARRQANACLPRVTPEVQRLQQEKEILGPLTEDDPIDKREQRAAINAALGETQGRLDNCRLVISRADVILNTVTQLEIELSRERMWSQSEPIWSVLEAAPAQIKDWPARISVAIRFERKEDVETSLKVPLLLVGVLAIGLGLFIRRGFRRWHDAQGYDEKPPPLKILFLKSVSRHAPWWILGLATSVMVISTMLAPDLDSVPIRITTAILAYGLACILIDRSTGPMSPAAEIDGLIPDFQAPLRLRLRLFFVASIASRVVLGPQWFLELPAEDMLLPHTLLVIGLVLPLIAGLRLAHRIPGLAGRHRTIRYIAMLALVVVLVAEFLGYYNLANYLIFGVVTTALAAFVLWMLLWLVDQAIDFITKGQTRLAYQVRTWLGVRPRTEGESGLGAYRLLFDLLLWLTFGVLVLNVWDTTGTMLNQLRSWVIDGVKIGDSTIVPIDIFIGITVFTGLIIATAWIKRLIQKRWLSQVRMDRGARDAITTMVGYVGFTVAVLIGLNLTGVDLTTIGIAAAALAVGIGLGLQDIVNNFVSGLILLFERPIKAGDFISIGEMEGWVKRISIRSTEIETMDRQNVLVPNSDLISEKVTNWVLRDPHIRLRIELGVAYGSDVELVRDVLIKVAQENEEVITDGRAPEPRALFVGFGDSALLFELRVWIRHVRKRFEVTSNLNFAIDKAFREQNITIPFPQRDLHVKTWSDKAAPPRSDAS